MTRIKELVRRSAPELFASMRNVRNRIMMEYRVFRRTNMGGLVRTLVGRSEPWQKLLPFQRPLHHVLADSSSSGDLVLSLDAAGAAMAGGHTVYLAPDVWRRTVLGPLASHYPDTAGLKLVRTPGTVADGHYFNEEMEFSHLQWHLHYGHPHMMLVANVLTVAGLGPRLYDLTEIELGRITWTAYVVEHVPGDLPTQSESAAGIARLRELASEKVLRVIAPDGFEHPDFQPPFNGNVRSDPAGRFQYVDFQNITLENHDRFVRRVAEEAAEATHFGDFSVLRGKYLYQSIPGFGKTGKRDVGARFRLMEEMMDACGVSVADRVVLDVGCNVGMMMAQYLRLGAAWCHGWDQPTVVPHTTKLLLSLGCTRFSLTGAPLDRDRPLIDDLPSFLAPKLDGCVISFLAIQGHIGWLTELTRIPWAFMLYEGHEHEDEAKADAILAELLRMVPGAKVALRRTVRDGDSDARTLAIITRS